MPYQQFKYDQKLYLMDGILETFKSQVKTKYCCIFLYLRRIHIYCAFVTKLNQTVEIQCHTMAKRIAKD